MSPAADMTDDLAERLRVATLRLAYGIRAPATAHGLTPSRLAAVVTLWTRGPMRAGDFARNLGITPPSATRLAEILIAKGLIERQTDPRDQRAFLLSLTEEGAEAMEAVRNEGLGQLTTQLGHLSDGEIDQLIEAIPVLERLASAFIPADHPALALHASLGERVVAAASSSAVD